MDELLQQLELRIKTFIQRFQQIEHTNSNLEQSTSLILREKEQLLTKNKMAITQIEHIVSRLKSIENLSND